MFNKPLLRNVRRFTISTHPEAHYQASYMDGVIDIPVLDPEYMIENWDKAVCGTQGCIAGWGSLFAGYHQIALPTWQYRTNPETGLMEEIRIRTGTDRVVDETGEEWSMHEAARIAFGFNHAQASEMFAAGRTRPQLIAIFDAIEEWPEEQDTDDLDFAAVIFTGNPGYYVDECNCPDCVVARAGI